MSGYGARYIRANLSSFEKLDGGNKNLIIVIKEEEYIL